MAASGTNVVRVVGFTLLLLGPVVIVLDRLDAVDELRLFVLAAAASCSRRYARFVIVVERSASTRATAVLMLMTRQTLGWALSWQAVVV